MPRLDPLTVPCPACAAPTHAPCLDLPADAYHYGRVEGVDGGGDPIHLGDDPMSDTTSPDLTPTPSYLTLLWNAEAALREAVEEANTRLVQRKGTTFVALELVGRLAAHSMVLETFALAEALRNYDIARAKAYSMMHSDMRRDFRAFVKDDPTPDYLRGDVPPTHPFEEDGQPAKVALPEAYFRTCPECGAPPESGCFLGYVEQTKWIHIRRMTPPSPSSEE